MHELQMLSRILLHMHISIGHGFKIVVEHMQVKHGADPQIFHRLSQATPAQLAGPHGHFEVEKYLTDVVFNKGKGKEVRTFHVSPDR
jgi:hypothetical protein